jgi:hypothetical protein
MADQPLDGRPQLAKGSMVFDDLKKWIVSKPGGPNRSQRNPSVTSGLALRENLPLRVGKYDMANIMGRALFKRHAG